MESLTFRLRRNTNVRNPKVVGDTSCNARDPSEHIPRPQSPPDGGAFSPTHPPQPDPAPHRPSRAAGRRPPSKKQYFCCLSGGQPAFWNHVLLVTGSGAIALITMLRKSPPAPRCGGGVGGEAPHPIPQLRNFGGPLYGPSTDPPHTRRARALSFAGVRSPSVVLSSSALSFGRTLLQRCLLGSPSPARA